MARLPGPQMSVETIHFRRSAGKLGLLLALGVMMTAASVWLVMIGGGASLRAGLTWLAGIVGALFFGAVTLLIAWQWLTGSATPLSIGPEGIRDSRVAPETIRWNEITEIGEYIAHGQPYVVLGVRPETLERLSFTRTARMTQTANRHVLGLEGVFITPTGLAASMGEITAGIAMHLPREVAETQTRGPFSDTGMGDML